MVLVMSYLDKSCILGSPAKTLNVNDHGPDSYESMAPTWCWLELGWSWLELGWSWPELGWSWPELGRNWLELGRC